MMAPAGSGEDDRHDMTAHSQEKRKKTTAAREHRRPLVIGLTGSIGMGKTATARLFAEAGVPVWDADAAVHRLYAPGAAGSRAIARLFPDAVTADGVDRARLRAHVLADDKALARLEAAVHPLVAADRTAFIERARKEGHDLVVFDIPLLFETGAEDEVDFVVVVSAPPDAQRERVLARGTVNEEELARILARQLPDAEKRRRADFVIDTSTPETAQEGVRALLARLRGTDPRIGRNGRSRTGAGS